ncbi:oligosaccharide repeat unit polymerase [Aeromonas veronii]
MFSSEYFIVFFIAIYKVFAKKGNSGVCFNNKYGYYLLFITAAFFCFNQVTGAGLAGSGYSFEGGSILNILFVLLQPDLLFFLIAPFLRSKRLFHIVSSVYCVSLLSRGWMGSIFLLFIVYLVRFYPVKITTRRFFYLAVLGFSIVMALPLLDGLKWGMRSGMSLLEVFNNVFNSNYFDLLGIVLDSIVRRFQNINYAAYVLQNSDYFHDSLLQGDFLWFYQDGMLNSVHCKFSSCVVDFNIFSAEKIYGESGLTWNIDPGLTGWISFLYQYVVLFLFFIISLLIFSYRTFSKFYDIRGILLLGCFVYIYLFHGWLGAFYNFVMYGLFLYIFVRFKYSKGSLNI